MADKTTVQADQDREMNILTLAYKEQIEAVVGHNDLAFKIFSWSTTLLLAAIGYVLSQSASLDVLERILLTAAIIAVCSITFWWQRRNFLETVEHGQNIERLHGILHLTDPGYFGIKGPVFDQGGHAARSASRARFGVSPHNLVLMAITAIVLLVLWKMA
jgi:hypothetical protein